MERRQSLSVGSRTYSIVTSMDEEKLQEISSIVSAMVAELNNKLSQDERLFLVALELSGRIVALKDRLSEMGAEGEPQGEKPYETHGADET